MRAGRKVSDFANTRSVVVGHSSMYTFNLNVGIGLDYSSIVGTGRVWLWRGPASACCCCCLSGVQRAFVRSEDD